MLQFCFIRSDWRGGKSGFIDFIGEEYVFRSAEQAIVIAQQEHMQIYQYTKYSVREKYGRVFLFFVYFQFILKRYNSDWVIGRKGNRHDKKEKTVN